MHHRHTAPRTPASSLGCDVAVRAKPRFGARRALTVLLTAATLGLAGCNSTSLEDSLQPIGNARQSTAARSPADVVKLEAPGPGRYGDRKPVDFGKHHPDRYPVHGIDISKWQGEIDWAEVPPRRALPSSVIPSHQKAADHSDARFAELAAGGALRRRASRTQP